MPHRGMHRFVRPRPKKIFFFMPDLGLCPSPEGNTFGQGGGDGNDVEMMDIRIPPVLTEKGNIFGIENYVNTGKYYEFRRD